MTSFSFSIGTRMKLRAPVVAPKARSSARHCLYVGEIGKLDRPLHGDRLGHQVAHLAGRFENRLALSQFGVGRRRIVHRDDAESVAFAQ